MADQRIACYMPNFHCQRNWVPMFIQILAIIRNNCFIVNREFYGSKRSDAHKCFTLSMIEDLVEKASTLSLDEIPRIPSSSSLLSAYPTVASQVSPSRHQVTVSTSQSHKQQRLLPNSNLEIEFLHEYSHRFALPKVNHVAASNLTKRRGVCLYCTYLYRKNIKIGQASTYKKTVKRTLNICVYCTAIDPAKRTHFLCKHHFDDFHNKN